MTKPDPKQIFDIAKLKATQPRKTLDQQEEEAQQQKKEKQNDK